MPHFYFTFPALGTRSIQTIQLCEVQTFTSIELLVSHEPRQMHTTGGAAERGEQAPIMAEG